MTVISSGDQTLVRSLTQRTQLYLSIYQPDTVLACQVNNLSAAKGDRTITYDNVTSGSHTNVKAGMTLMVGSSAGLDDLGRIRVRSADATTITVAENSHINWSDDLYLTVIDFFEINAVYPRITQNATDVDFFKDYDIAYTDQNSTLGSLIWMGGHYAGFTEDDVYYSASGTIHVGGDTLSYHWDFDGGSPATATGQEPGYVSYSTPGHYTTTLTVSGTSTGAVDTSYRHVSIYDRLEDGSQNPILNWEFEQLSGDRNKGGYTAKIIVRESGMDDSIVQAGSLVVIFADTWYQKQRQFIGGNSKNRGSILFAGYILKGSIEYDYAASTISFDVGSPTEIMKQAEGFSISVEDSTDPAGVAANNSNYPSGWVLLKNMDIKTALYHYLRWHTTVLNCTDIRWVGTDRPIQYFDSDRTSIYDAMKTLIFGTLWGNVVSDRQGAVYLETPIWSSAESSNFNTNMPLSSQDFLFAVSIEDEQNERVSFGEYGGIAWSSAVTGTYDAFLTAVPGTAPGYRGGVDRSQGLALYSQDQLNILAGDSFAQKNVRYPAIVTPMAGSYFNMDIAPQEFIPITVDSNDNNRGVSFQAKNFFVKNISYDIRAGVDVLNSTITFEEIQSDGFAGDTIPVPPVPTESETGGGYDVPNIIIPPIGGFNITVESDGIDRIWSNYVDPAWNAGSGSPVERVNNEGYTDVPDGSSYWFNHNFFISPSATAFTMYIVSRNGVSTGSGDVYQEYNWKSSTIGTPGTRKSGSGTATQTVTGSTNSEYYFTQVDFTIGGAGEIAAGDYVNMEIRVDRSSDPPDTFTGSWRHVGLLIIFT